jgi:hypothetical protein
MSQAKSKGKFIRRYVFVEGLSEINILADQDWRAVNTIVDPVSNKILTLMVHEHIATPDVLEEK